MTIAFKKDPALERFIRDTDSDDLVAKADAVVDLGDGSSSDFMDGVKVGMLVRPGKDIWELVTEDRNVYVYFVGSYVEVLDRIDNIKKRVDPVSSELELEGVTIGNEEL